MPAPTVARLRWRHVAVPFRSTVRNARESFHVRESVVVQVSTRDGTIGVGEAALPPDSPLATSARVLDEWFGAVAIRLLRANAEHWPGGLVPLGSPYHGWRPAAVCGVEAALADVVAAARGEPLRVHLARAAQIAGAVEAVEANGLIDLQEPDGAAAAASTLAGEGFQTIKLKLGGAVEQAIGVVRAVRGAVGPAIALRCDANGAWSFEDAHRFLSAASEVGVVLCEEPLSEPGERYQDLARLRRESPVPVAVDESTRSLAALDELIEAGGADAVVVKPMATGLREALVMIASARKAGIAVVVTTTLDLAPGTALAMHVAALAGDPPPACGVATLDLVEDPLGSGVPSVEAGRVTLGDRSGLGVALDHPLIERYAVGPWREASV